MLEAKKTKAKKPLPIIPSTHRILLVEHKKVKLYDMLYCKYTYEVSQNNFVISSSGCLYCPWNYDFESIINLYIRTGSDRNERD